MLNFGFVDPSKATSHVQVINDSTYILPYPCNSLSDCTPYKVSLPAGAYIFEVWGAQGGTSYGGKGGYSKGLIHLNRQRTAYIFVGGQGGFLNETKGATKPSFYGGGVGTSAHEEVSTKSASGGGGAPDIRINNYTLYHRVIVAGGGGGVSFHDEINNGGYGGGAVGGDCDGKGGTQTESPQLNKTEPGSFGYGGSGKSIDSTKSGGGGGWYGGSTSRGGKFIGGAGGSGYVLNETSHKPDGYALNDTGYYLISSQLLSGNETFFKCLGQFKTPQQYETGHEGSGCARITVLYFYGTQIHRTRLCLFHFAISLIASKV